MATKSIVSEAQPQVENRPQTSDQAAQAAVKFDQEQRASGSVESTSPRSRAVRPRSHGSVELRGLANVPRSPLFDGRFGRMFRNLPPLQSEIADLNALAATIIAKPGERPPDNPEITAGYTYFGQFIDHDITFDPTSLLQRDNDPNALVDFRTPRFDLDSMYGTGPADQPYLYQEDGVRMRIGKTVDGEDDVPRTSLDKNDGTRSTQAERLTRRALQGDPRNDENIIVNQLHLAFLKYHNHVVADLESEGVTGSDNLFNLARQIVRWHYQWLVIFDFLPRIVGREVVDDILKIQHYVVHRLNGSITHRDGRTAKVDLKFFHWKNDPFMPVEFSGACYRFGHSMVRGAYVLNDITPFIPIFSSDFRSEFSDLRGFRERPSHWEIEWQRFFRFPESSKDPQQSSKIDTKLAAGLGVLPFQPDLPSLAARNLQRGQALGLPSGQTLARAMGLPEELILKRYHLGLPSALGNKFGDHSPLWFYILKEAEVMADGMKLGPVAGRIVAEVLIGLLCGDNQSFISIAPGWTPRPNRYGVQKDGSFTLPDLIRYAGSKIKGVEAPAA